MLSFSLTQLSDRIYIFVIKRNSNYTIIKILIKLHLLDLADYKNQIFRILSMNTITQKNV